MQNIKPISKLKNKSNESQQVQLDIYAKLVKAEEKIANGDEGTEFISFAKKMRENIQGII